MQYSRLIAVLEFDPFEYRTNRRSPEQPLPEDPCAWSEFWNGSMRDAGIVGMEPLVGTWVVDIDQITSSDWLTKALVAHFNEPSLAAFFENLPGPFEAVTGVNEEGEFLEEHFGPLRGGIALCEDGLPVLTPECCGDLSNWRDWLNATRTQGEAWCDLWIGHPSARVCRKDQNLLVQKVLESGEIAGEPRAVEVVELGLAVDAVKARLEHLAVRITAILEPVLGAALAERAARQLAGLSDFQLD